MDNPVAYQALIHQATTVDEVADVLRQFFARLSAPEAACLPNAIASIATFSEHGLVKKAKLAAAARDCPSAQAANGLLVSAALKVSILQMDSRPKRRGLLRIFRRR
jgi:formate dehydrogenase maturation protein FdhE